MALGSEFGDILDSLRGYISDSLDSLRALFRGGAEEGAPAARAAEEIIGEGGSMDLMGCLERRERLGRMARQERRRR